MTGVSMTWRDNSTVIPSGTFYPTNPGWPYRPYCPQPKVTVIPSTQIVQTGLSEDRARDLVREELARLFPEEAKAAAEREAPCDKCGRQ